MESLKHVHREQDEQSREENHEVGRRCNLVDGTEVTNSTEKHLQRFYPTIKNITESKILRRRGIKRSREERMDESVEVTAKKRKLSSPEEEKHLETYKHKLSQKGMSPARFVAGQRRPYGGGEKRRNKKLKRNDDGSNSNSENGNSPPMNFPDDEEMQFFKDNVLMSTEDPTLKRENSAFLKLQDTRIKFTGLDKIDDETLHQHVSKIIDIFIRWMTQKANGSLKETQYWLTLNHPGCINNEAFHVTHKTYADVQGSTVMNALAKLMQSNKNVRMDESFSITMYIFKEKRFKLVGKGIVPRKGVHGTERIRNVLMQKMFGPKQNRVIGDSHCLPKALALGKIESDMKALPKGANKEELSTQLYNLTRHDVALSTRAQNQLTEAKKLLMAANLDPEVKEHDRTDLIALASYLVDYQIKVWTIDGMYLVPIEVERFNPEGTKFIGLFYFRNHYEYVNHTKGTDPCRFCYKCSTFANDNHYLYCKAKCMNCGTTTCEPGTEKIVCDKCNVYFRSQDCYEKHLKPVSGKAKPHCQKYIKCKICGGIDRQDKKGTFKHVCGGSYCKICKEKLAKGHECGHPLPTEKDKKKKRDQQRSYKVIVYDMECIVANSGEYTEHVERGPKHKPNLICTQMFCNECLGRGPCKTCQEPCCYSYKDVPENEILDDSDDDGDGDYVEDDEYEFDQTDIDNLFTVKKRNTPLARFAKFLLEDPRANNAYIVAHNGGSYDHVMLLAELDRQAGMNSQDPKMLVNGLKIISADFKCGKRKLDFRDSLQYLQMGLSKMPGAFGLTGETKGHFPHLYNHPDNYDKSLPTLPAREYYSPQFMTPEAASEFETWYTENYNNGFILHDELLKYCNSDVRILVLTLVCFIQMCQDIFNDWNPLVNSRTLASYVMFVLKHEYIKPGDVGFIPESGYGTGSNSKIALKYLQWLEKKDPSLHLKYQLRGGEHKIEVDGRIYSVDGFNERTNEVFEIYGCYWHGCPKCFPKRDKKHPVRKDVTMVDLYEETIRRENELKRAGYTVNAKWTCEIDKEKAQNEEMKEFIDLNQYDKGIHPRDGLFGGRTQVFRSFVRATDLCSIQYYDFVSMYPYLNVGGTEYPRGNPTIITDNLPKAGGKLEHRGLVKCDVLPPKSAKIGILPQRIHKKLMFTLCRSCAVEQNIKGCCRHRKVSQRYISGTWTTDEVKKAVSKGYRVLKYHTILHWDDDKCVKGGFLADYIKPLLAIKHQSSGWPKEDMTEDEKQKHIENIFRKDGVKLDINKIKPNKALRSLAKIFLNSAWGKFAQNPMKTETRLVYRKDGSAYTNFFNDAKYEGSAIIPFGKNKYFISRKPREEFLQSVPFTNLAIAAITTSAGRLLLMEAMEKVGIENLIYCDTDSLIFKQIQGMDPLGDMKGTQLGALTNEIPEGKKLVEVVCMAPKVYSLKMEDSNGQLTYSVKAKGMTMNYGNAKKINHTSMAERMHDFNTKGTFEPLQGEMFTFKRGDNMLDGLYTYTAKKNLNPRMDKGHYNTEGVVTPFGWQPEDGEELEDDYPFY